MESFPLALLSPRLSVPCRTDTHICKVLSTLPHVLSRRELFQRRLSPKIIYYTVISKPWPKELREAETLGNTFIIPALNLHLELTREMTPFTRYSNNYIHLVCCLDPRTQNNHSLCPQGSKAARMIMSSIMTHPRPQSDAPDQRPLP